MHGNLEHTDSGQREEGCGITLGRTEGTSQRKCVNDPWTWTMVWGQTVRAGVGLGGGGQRGKNETTVIK